MPTQSLMSIGQTLTIDIESLKLSEVAEIEETAGISIDALARPNVPKPRLLQAIAWIAKRREDPEFTFERAGELEIGMLRLGRAERPVRPLSHPSWWRLTSPWPSGLRMSTSARHGGSLRRRKSHASAGPRA